MVDNDSFINMGQQNPIPQVHQAPQIHQVPQVSFVEHSLSLKLEERKSVIQKRKMLIITGVSLMVVSFLFIVVFGPPPLDGLFGVYRATELEEVFGQIGWSLAVITPFIVSVWAAIHMFKVEKTKPWVPVLAAIGIFILTVILLIALIFFGWSFMDNYIDPIFE